MLNIGMRLRELREKNHLSQEDMGKKVGRSKPVISSYENNLKVPPLDVLISIAALYNVSLDYLVGIEKSEMIFTDGLTESQKEIIYTIFQEFSSENEDAIGLSKRQQQIIADLMKEFSSN